MTFQSHDPKKRKQEASRDRRKNFRVDCPVRVRIALEESPDDRQNRIEAKVLNLSLGGIRVEIEVRKMPARDLNGDTCSITFLAAGMDKTFPGRFVGVYHKAPQGEGQTAQKTLEAGIRFEGLSIDDQFALVDLFGKIHTPLDY